MGTKGTKCGDETNSQRLPVSQKIVYIGHRKWLQHDDPWRKDKKNFNGRTEPRPKPREKTGYEIYEIVRNLEVVAGKANPQAKEKNVDGPVWKRRSVFWDLPYWKFLQSRHTIDVMHVEKNMCDSLLGLLMNNADKTKDGPKARKDLEFLGIRKKLWAVEEESPEDHNCEVTVTTRCKPACYTLSKAELHIMC